MENSDPGSEINVPDPQHWSELRKTTFPWEWYIGYGTCLVHVGAGVADGGYGKLDLQPQPHHILTTTKMSCDNLSSFHARTNQPIPKLGTSLFIPKLYRCRLP
jgi:hypothetical protein